MGLCAQHTLILQGSSPHTTHHLPDTQVNPTENLVLHTESNDYAAMSLQRQAEQFHPQIYLFLMNTEKNCIFMVFSFTKIFYVTVRMIFFRQP